MWLVVIVASTVFLGMLAIVSVGYVERERQRDKAAARMAETPVAQLRHCPHCNAPLRNPEAETRLPSAGISTAPDMQNTKGSRESIQSVPGHANATRRSLS